MLSEQNLHRIITALPGIAIAFGFLLSRQVGTALVLFACDIIGAIIGVWWMNFSKNIAHQLHSKFEKQNTN